LDHFTEEKNPRTAVEKNSPIVTPRRKESNAKVISEIHYDDIQTALMQLGKNWNFNMFFITDCSQHSVVICGKFMVKKHSLD
jgi:hypothetical protein